MALEGKKLPCTVVWIFVLKIMEIYFEFCDWYLTNCIMLQNFTEINFSQSTKPKFFNTEINQTSLVPILAPHLCGQ